MKKTLLAALFMVALTAGSQSINPKTDIRWTVASGCGTAGYSYSPQGGSCILAGLPAVYYPGAGVTIAQAITAAGTTGSVVIPANYTGMDTFSSNPNGVSITDWRPNSSTHKPKNYIYASDFGALCNGTSIDSPAIQAAINSAQWAFNYPLQAYKENMIILPQGTCGIVSALTFTGFNGGMRGAGNDATYLVGLYDQWTGSDNNVIDIVATGPQAGGASVGIREFSDFAVIGNFNAGIVSQGMRIWNTSNEYLTNYTIANLDIERVLFAQFDTCFVAEDMSNSQIVGNILQNCRVGLSLYGNDQNNYIAHNTIDAGTLAFTSNTGDTTGAQVIQNTKYGGGSEQPQGVYFHDNSIEDWTLLLLDEECIACAFDYNQLDLAGSTGIQIDENGIGGYGVWVDHNQVGINSTTGTGIILAGIADSPHPANLGFWLEDNQIGLDNYPGNLPSSNVGISIQSAAPLANAHITGNQCMGQSECILVGQNLYDSVITDNFAVGTTTYVINLAGASSLVHADTVVDRNFDYYDSVTGVNVGSSSGAVVLFNCTASGCTTPTWPTLAAGNGFTGTKTAGTCVLTVVSGIITNIGTC